jgi:signal transduction histidine kinase
MAGEKILIVDDMEENVELLRGWLSSNGYDVSVAWDGESGLEKALRDDPDLLLVDLLLPKLTGIEVLMELRERRPEMMVVLTTAYGSEQVAVDALRRGVNDYLINKRPFDQREVLEVVQRALKEGELRRENARLARELEAANEQLRQHAAQLQQTVAELEEANARMRSLERAKASFLTMISHELRTPLSVARGYIDLVADGGAGEIPELARHYLSVAAQNAEYLGALIDDLLAMSQLSAGEYSLQREEVSLASLIREVVLAHQHQAENLSVCLRADLPRGEQKVIADPLRMMQVLNNLVENALKFTPRGGEVTVRLANTNGEMRVTVADTGRGIPLDQLKLVFDEFYQGDKPVNEIRPGVGLGLTICRSLVDLHGGRIWAESKADGGTRVHFTVPRLANRGAAAESSPSL